MGGCVELLFSVFEGGFCESGLQCGSDLVFLDFFVSGFECMAFGLDCVDCWGLLGLLGEGLLPVGSD